MSWMLFAMTTGCGIPAAQAETPATVASPDDNPEELGRVRWQRGYDGALSVAAATGKPLLVLFDEVPGCSTVKAYGRGTLSDPLVVDAVESLFVPVVVYNNEVGPDRETLEQFGEPSWNNPVVRIVDATGADLVPRLTNDWSRGALLTRMKQALRAADAPVPAWLELVQWELTQTEPQTATYSMACFWSGEAHLGAAEGVLATRTGWQSGKEVVEVTYDATRIQRHDLDALAKAGRASVSSGTDIRPTPGDDRHALRNTAWGAVPMSPAQATRVNAAVAAGLDPSRWLSPQQLRLHEQAVAGHLPR